MVDILFITLGIIIGILISAITIHVAISFATPINRKMKQIKSVTSAKGSILEPEDGELSGWVDNLPTE